MSLTKVTYSMIQGAAVNVLDYGVLADGTTNNSATLAAALADVPANGTLYFPAGVYCGYLIIYRSDITIMGDGSASTILKLPNNCPTITVPHDGVPNPITGLPNVIEVGECALGNAANTYERINVIGLTLDGNYTNNTAPTTDLFGHGMILTKTSKCFIDDVVAQNCYATGIDNVINSNYNKINATTINCGHALISGGYYPNFDINSSKYSRFKIISSGGKYGGRMLDNCWSNSVEISVYNPSITGFIYDNQSVNASYSNIVNVTVVDGCTSGQGVSIGNNCHNSIINATIRNAASTGFYVAGSSDAFQPRGNQFNISTYGCGGASTYASGKQNKYEITSRYDGDVGVAGSSFAVEIIGGYNQFIINVEDQPTPQVRGVVIRLGAQNNNIIDYKRNITVQDFLLEDTSNTNIWYFQYADGASLKWQTPSLNAGWNNSLGAPYAFVQYFKDINGVVRLKGRVTGGTGTIITLPAGYRPVDTMIFPTYANGALGVLTVDSLGVVTLAVGTATSVDLSPIQFATF